MLKKRWQKNEINEIINLRKNGMKMILIAKKFNVTQNAIRKTLQRYCMLYNRTNLIKKAPKIDNSFNEVSMFFAIQYGLNNNILYKKDNQLFDQEKKIENSIQALITINNYRQQINLPILNVR